MSAAFPTHGGGEDDEPINRILGGGMTLRDYFAAKAMAAVIAHHGIYEDEAALGVMENFKRASALTFDQAAEYGYGQADAMLAERAK